MTKANQTLKTTLCAGLACAIFATTAPLFGNTASAAPFKPSQMKATALQPSGQLIRVGKRADRRRAFLLGLLGGAVVTGVIAEEQRKRRKERRKARERRFYSEDVHSDEIYVERRPRRAYRDRELSARAAHQRWCYNRYQSYDHRTDSFIAFSGEPRQCISPYL